MITISAASIDYESLPSPCRVLLHYTDFNFTNIIESHLHFRFFRFSLKKS
jgi:hypothetical protein